MGVLTSIVLWVAASAASWTGTVLALTDASTTALIQTFGVVISALITTAGAVLVVKVSRDLKGRDDDDS